MWQCPKCGSDVANISPFCPKCGYSEEQYTGKVSTINDGKGNTVVSSQGCLFRENKMYIIFWIVVILTALALSHTIYYYTGNGLLIVIGLFIEVCVASKILKYMKKRTRHNKMVSNLYRALREDCNENTSSGFPECEQCYKYKKAGCKFYSQKVAQSVKQEPRELSDSTIICLHANRGGIRVFCCDYKTMPLDAIEQILESDNYTEGYACIKDNSAYEQIKKDFSTFCNNTGLNNHYEEPGTYIDYTKHQEPTQCVSCNVFPWVICEWKGETSSIPRPRDYSSVKLSEAQKRFCDSFDRDADRNADYWNKQGLR